jgi:hypothetical protein
MKKGMQDDNKQEAENICPSRQQHYRKQIAVRHTIHYYREEI